MLWSDTQIHPNGLASVRFGYDELGRAVLLDNMSPTDNLTSTIGSVPLTYYGYVFVGILNFSGMVPYDSSLFGWVYLEVETVTYEQLSFGSWANRHVSTLVTMTSHAPLLAFPARFQPTHVFDHHMATILGADDYPRNIARLSASYTPGVHHLNQQTSFMAAPDHVLNNPTPSVLPIPPQFPVPMQDALPVLAPLPAPPPAAPPLAFPPGGGPVWDFNHSSDEEEVEVSDEDWADAEALIEDDAEPTTVEGYATALGLTNGRPRATFFSSRHAPPSALLVPRQTRAAAAAAEATAVAELEDVRSVWHPANAR